MVGACAVFVVVLAVAGLVVWDRDWRHAGGTNPGFSCPSVVHAKHRLPFTAKGVHRVLLIGDSIMVQASCAVADGLADTGVETYRQAASGTGLLNGALDWVAQTQALLSRDHPDAVVAIFVGNYPFPPARDISGRVIADDTPAFFAAWQQRAEQLSAEVRKAGARMYWVSPPPIVLPVLSHAALLYEGYRKIPGVHTLDAGRVLAGPNGKAVVKKSTCGRTVVLRTPDGVHLTEDGARIYGQEIAHELTAGLGIFTAPQPC
jgi:hypothetical protein